LISAYLPINEENIQFFMRDCGKFLENLGKFSGRTTGNMARGEIFGSLMFLEVLEARRRGIKIVYFNRHILLLK